MKKMLEKIKNWYENDNFKEVYSKVMSENGIDINAIKVGDQVIVRHDLHEDMDVPFGVGSEMLFWKGKMVTVTEVHPDSEAIYVEGNNWVWSLPLLEAHIPQTPPQIMELNF